MSCPFSSRRLHEGKQSSFQRAGERRPSIDYFLKVRIRVSVFVSTVPNIVVFIGVPVRFNSYWVHHFNSNFLAE
jgi:hypothetical protein